MTDDAIICSIDAIRTRASTQETLLVLAVPVEYSAKIAKFLTMVGQQVGVAFATIEDKTMITTSMHTTEQKAKEAKPFGAKAALLHKNGTFMIPAILKAIGTDAEFLEWIRLQPCAITGEFDRNADEATGEVRYQCDAAHYRSIEGGSGMGIKSEYSAIPLTHAWHDKQTRKAMSVFADQLRNRPDGMDDETAGRLWMERRRNHYVSLWASTTLAESFGQHSMGFVNPEEVCVWADVCEVGQWLPPGYR